MARNRTEQRHCSRPVVRVSSFSLTGDEYPLIIKTAVDTCRGKVPIIAGAGGPRLCDRRAWAAEAGNRSQRSILLLDRTDRGGDRYIAAHRQKLYATSLKLRRDRLATARQNRHADNAGQGWRAFALTSWLQGTSIRRHRTDGLRSIRDGAGRCSSRRFCRRRRCITAAYKALGTPVYSSAVFSFIPRFYGDGLPVRSPPTTGDAGPSAERFRAPPT